MLSVYFSEMELAFLLFGVDGRKVMSILDKMSLPVILRAFQ